MASIQIRDIPEDDYEIIRKRARAAGKSIQSYMRDEVIAMARRRNKAEVMAAIESTLAKYPSPDLGHHGHRRGHPGVAW
ncbi:BrnA antitoxin family protein [Goodfellowiella coeruleoviolacea]|uniref:BrnA antitoxin family protein n=1 Tax=Goodfellowiella coeruleoviolacea TaxID=334858 RepID=UPI0020A259E9|nr:BrnA antitoxin family protein [Goodfellowiella coeruleoviolacea]